MRSTRAFFIGRVGGLEISAYPSALAGFIILWVLLGLAGWLLGLQPIQAVLGGVLAALLHFLSELWHTLGHQMAARRTGYPMKALRYWLFLGMSIYPKDEPELPAATHVKRASGGPLASLLLTVIAGLAALALRPANGLSFWLVLFLFLDNLLVFTLGALLPLGFTDGSTFLKYMKK